MLQASFTSQKTTPALWHLYSNIVFIIDHPASSVDFARVVLTIACGLTLPTKMAPLRFTKSCVKWCIAFLRVFAIFEWIARTLVFLAAR